MKTLLKRMSVSIIATLITLLTIGACSIVFAQESTLDVILKRGKFIVGVDLSNPPFGLYDAQKQPAGFDVDLAKLIAQELGVELEIIDIRSANRIPYLLTKKIDATIATFGPTPERAKSVAFTLPYCSWNLVLLGYKKDTDVRSYKDLAGKKVGVPRGTTQDIALTRVVPKGTEIVRFEDDPTCILALETGKVDAVGTGETIALQLAKRNPQLELKGTFSLSWCSIGVRRNDLEWLNWLNNFLMWHGGKGTLGEIYEKWNGVPMPRALPVW